MDADGNHRQRLGLRRQPAVKPAGLAQRPREPVQNVAVGRVRLLQPDRDHLIDQGIGNQFPAAHDLLGYPAQLRSLGHIGAQQVAGGDLRNSPQLHQFLGLGSLARARRAQQKNRAGKGFRPTSRPCSTADIDEDITRFSFRVCDRSAGKSRHNDA